MCLQVEEVRDAHNWTSVIVTGWAELLPNPDAREQAARLITLIKPEPHSGTQSVGKWRVGARQRRGICKIEVDRTSGRRGRRPRTETSHQGMGMAQVPTTQSLRQARKLRRTLASNSGEVSACQSDVWGLRPWPSGSGLVASA